MKKIMCVVGTRPEAIKMAPVILELKKNPSFKTIVLATAQHREMLDQVLNLFKIVPDIDLNIMQPNQSLTLLTSRLLEKIDSVLLTEKPDVVLVQGDTTTVMSLALACFYHKIPIGHIEAGLRTHDLYNPFPEEANRLISSLFARWHFAPTESSKNNLLKEGVDPSKIHVTGNSVIDALYLVSKSIPDTTGSRNVLITCHRRENFGQPFIHICNAIAKLASQNPDWTFTYPVHPNPNIKDIAKKKLSEFSNIQLIDPLEYLPFVTALKNCSFVITDSGGVQEEAPALGKPVVVLRTETERPEAVEFGVVKLVGPDEQLIFNEAQKLIHDADYRKSMSKGVSPYGDGNTAMRINQILSRDLLLWD